MGEILNHLFEMVLEDESLNDKKRLLSIVSEQFTDVKYSAAEQQFSQGVREAVNAGYLYQDYLNLDIDFTYISREVIPMLKAAGLTEDDIHTIMVENPRRFFEGV